MNNNKEIITARRMHIEVQIPEWAFGVAQDVSGNWWAFEFVDDYTPEPSLRSNSWITKAGLVENFAPGIAPKDWTKTMRILAIMDKVRT